MVKGSIQTKEGASQFHYQELVYCERPTVQRFLALVEERKIVFEFLMREQTNHTIRNHGYPWRLMSDAFLDQLFGFQIQLR